MLGYTLYNKTEAVQDKSRQESAGTLPCHSLAELLAYIDESRKDENITVFKLADLCKLYSTRFEQIGGEQHDHLHSTRLKNRILAHFPDLTAHKEGHDIYEDSKSCCHDTSLYGCDLTSCARTQPQSSTSDFIGSATLQLR